MNKAQQALLVVAILGLAGVLFALVQTRTKRRDAISERSYQIGQDLISTTNSNHLLSLRPGLSDQLSNLLASPTYVSAVLLGDEPSPVGDGSACSRLILTNQLRRGLELRLAPALLPDKFQILGYWVITDHPAELKK